MTKVISLGTAALPDYWRDVSYQVTSFVPLTKADEDGVEEDVLCWYAFGRLLVHPKRLEAFVALLQGKMLDEQGHADEQHGHPDGRLADGGEHGADEGAGHEDQDDGQHDDTSTRDPRHGEDEVEGSCEFHADEGVPCFLECSSCGHFCFQHERASTKGERDACHGRVLVGRHSSAGPTVWRKCACLEFEE